MTSNIQLNNEFEQVPSIEDLRSDSSKESAISSANSSSLLGSCTNCQSTLLEKKFSQLETKIDTIFSLASALNSRSLEQNSQTLYQMSELQENRASMKNANCLNLVVRIIYDEWNELFEFFNLYKEHKPNRSIFSLFKNKSTFIEILNRRLLSRKLACQTLSNLISSKFLPQNSQPSEQEVRKKLNVFNFIRKITEFNENYFSFIISHIDSHTLNSVGFNEELASSSANILSIQELTALNESLSELTKRSFDEEQRLYLIAFGGAHAICELFTILWNFVEYFKKISSKSSTSNVILNDVAHKLSLNSIIIISNLTINTDLNGELYGKRYWLISVHSSLNKLLNNLVFALKSGDIIESNLMHDLIKSHICLIRNLSYKPENVNNFVMNEVNFARLLAKCALVYSSKYLLNDRCLSLKIVLQGLVNLSTLSMSNKESICNVKGMLQALVALLKPKNDSVKDQVFMSIEELACSLLRSLSVYCSETYPMKKILLESDLYSIILNYLLLSDNLNVVANACGTLWSLSAKSVEEQALLLDLGAEVKLTALSKTSNKLISIISMATLKNLQKLKSNTAKLKAHRLIDDTQNNSNSLTDSTSGLDLSVSSSSSFSFYSNLPALASHQKRTRQKSPPISNEVLINTVLDNLKDLSELSFELSDLKNLDGSGSNSSLSSICSPNSSNSSSDSLAFSSASTTSTFSNQSYELERRIKTKKSQIRTKDVSSVTKKHVTFSGMETYLFEAYSSDNMNEKEESDTQDEEPNCAVEQIDMNDTELDLEESFDTFSGPSNYQPATHTNKEESQPDNYFYNSYNPIPGMGMNSPDANLSSLSLLLEPAKQLISKINAHLNSDNMEQNDQVDNKVEEATVPIADENNNKSMSCMSPVSSAQNIFNKITSSRIPAKKKPKSLASCVNMTKTSQLRQHLSQQANRSESAQPRASSKPQIPKRTTSLQPSNKIVGKSSESELSATRPANAGNPRTNSFIIMERIKKMASKDNGEFVYEV